MNHRTGPRGLHHVVAVLAAAVLLVGLPACGDDDAASSTTGAAAASKTAFPVTIRHQLGTTKIDAEPTRVVSVGLRDQDFILALGVKPVGVRDWYGDQPNAVWPWARDELGSAKPTIVGNGSELNFEKIAELQPDLIIGLYAGLTDDQYNKLSRIAPTVADSDRFPDYAITWQAQLEITARALGREAQGKAITDRLLQRFAAVRKEHPEFRGKKAVYGGLAGDPGIYTSVDQRGGFLTSLGFAKIPAIDRMAPKSDAYFAGFSRERYRLFDQDVAVIVGPGGTQAAQTKDQPLYKRLNVVRDGRAIFLDELQGRIAGALTFGSPLSLDYALDAMVPRLAAATDDDPTTAPEPEPRV